MSRRIAVRAIAMHEGKLLAVRLKAYRGSIKGDFWCLPGGGVDEGEPLLPAIEREMIEETGIKPEVSTLLYVQQFMDDGKENLEFFFHITNAEDYLAVDLSSTTHGDEEIDELKFVNPKDVYILPRLLSEVDLIAKVANPGAAEFHAEL